MSVKIIWWEALIIKLILNIVFDKPRKLKTRHNVLSYQAWHHLVLLKEHINTKINREDEMTRGLKKLSTHPLGFAWSWSFMILIFEVSDGEVKMLLWWLLLMPILTRTVAPGGPDQSGSESPVYFLNSPLVTCSALAGPRPPLYSLIYTAHRQLGAILTCLSTDLLRFAPDTFSLWGYNGKFIGITSVARSQPKSLLHLLKPFMVQQIKT